MLSLRFQNSPAVCNLFSLVFRKHYRSMIVFGFVFFLIAVDLAVGETNEITVPSSVNEKLAVETSRARDPFWPVGFYPADVRQSTLGQPQSNVPEKEEGQTNKAFGFPDMLRIGGVVKKGDKFYVTINGFTVQTGEVVYAVAEGEVFKFVVEVIDFKKVQVRPLKK